MSEPPERLDALLEGLRDAPLPEPSPAVDARVRAKGRHEYARARRDDEPSLLREAALAGALTTVTVVYLACALHAASALYR
jgi:hypothetical protein